MTLNEYLNTLKGRSVAVIGIGVSNTPLIELLAAEGISVTACDKRDRTALGETAGRLEAMGVTLQLGQDYLDGLHHDVIFRTPGLRPDVPQLKAAGKTVYVGGNIGHPLLCEAGQMRPDDFAVLELSSFQLMSMTCSPHIAVVTNLAPNHLDWHTGMEEYVWAKENLIRHQKAEDVAVFNLDNDVTCELSQRACGRVRFFSRQDECSDGVFLRDGSIISRRDGQERTVLTTADIKLPGVHNVENYMAAIAAVDGIVPDEVIVRFAREFGGVEHRIELVRTWRGIRFYNDSIASSPSRTTAGLRSFPEKVILIAGGYDKHIPFDALGPEIVAHVKTLVLCGATADKIEEAVRKAPGYVSGRPEILRVSPFQKAVEAARDAAVAGDVVTLSPACAAFDQFKNFAERGKTFKAIVNGWEE